MNDNMMVDDEAIEYSVKGLKLVPRLSPVLRLPAQKVDFKQPPFDPIEFAHEMTQFAIGSGYKSLAANQVGVPYQVIVLIADPVLVLYNPRVVYSSPETHRLGEASPLYPGLEVRIKRPAFIRLRYEQPNGKTLTNEYRGVTARLILHHMDFLAGKLFYNNASLYERERAFRKMGKLT